MTGTEWALLLKPLFFLVIFGLILLPIRLAFIRWFPEGKLKRILLFGLDSAEKPVSGEHAGFVEKPLPLEGGLSTPHEKPGVRRIK